MRTGRPPPPLTPTSRSVAEAGSLANAATNALFMVGMGGLAVGLYYLYVGAARAEAKARSSKTKAT